MNIDDKDKELTTQCHLAAYDVIKAAASWLENPDNEVFGLLEYDNDSLDIATKACVLASAVLQKAAMDIQVVSGISDIPSDDKNTIETMASIRAIADELDSSGDPALIKKASALDEILLSMASSVETKERFQKAIDDKIARIKEKSSLDKTSSESPVKKPTSEDSKKKVRPLEKPLSTRYCPVHTGHGLIRLRDGLFYCELGNEQYDFKEGYTANGKHVPGTSVENQTADNYENNIIQSIFNTK